MEQIIPYVSCICDESEFEEALAQGFAEIYITTKDGILKHQKLSGGRHIRLKLDKVPERVKKLIKEPGVKVTEELNFLPAGKIPMKLYNQIVKFFKEVMRVKNADHEAHCFILWNEKDGYHISVPKQSVSKASVSFTYDKDAIPDGSVVVVDIHSHNTMGAFFSGTDNNNDQNGIYYSAVVGQLDKPQHAFVMRFNMHETKRRVELDEVFEAEGSKVEVPEEWLDKVEVKAPVYSGYSGSLVGKQNGGNPKEGFARIGSQIPQEYESLWDMQMRYFGLDPDKIPSKKEGSEVDHTPSVDDFLSMEAEDTRDPVGGDGEFDYLASQFGVPAAEAKEQIESYLVDIEGNDEILQDLMRSLYNVMSRQGQERINTYGL